MFENRQHLAPCPRIVYSVRMDNHRPARPGPVTIALAAVQVGAWGALWMLSPVPAEGGRIPSSTLILAGATDADLVWQGEVWRLLASQFLHADAGHLAVNVVGGFLLCLLAERVLGTARTLLVYLAAGLAGSLASAAFAAGPSAGASGAVLGTMGALVTWALIRREAFPPRLRLALLVAAACFVAVPFLAGTGAGADRVAHLGGLAAGIASGLAFGRVENVRIAAAVLAVLAAASLVRGLLCLVV